MKKLISKYDVYRALVRVGFSRATALRIAIS